MVKSKKKLRFRKIDLHDLEKMSPKTFAEGLQDPSLYRTSSRMEKSYLQDSILSCDSEIKKRGVVEETTVKRTRYHLQRYLMEKGREAEEIFEERNSYLDEDSIDVHYLYAAESLSKVTKFLSSKREEMKKGKLKHKKITVITGRGKHSRNGLAVLKPKIKSFLTKNNLKFDEFEGKFMVHLGA